MMRNNATEEFKMKCRNDHKREKLGHYADLRNGGLMPDDNKSPTWLPICLILGALGWAGIIYWLMAG